MAKAVAKSASRSLDLFIAKCKANGGFQFDTFTKLNKVPQFGVTRNFLALIL